MPYNRKRNYRRRRYYRKGKKYGYFGKFGNDATRALKMAGKALALINTEHKHIDTENLSSGATPIPGTTMYHLNNIIQGTNDNERIGNSVKNTSIYLREFWTNPSTTDNKVIRRLVVKWLVPNGVATPTITDILAQNGVISPRNIDKAKQFKILSDETFNVSSQAYPSVFKEKYIKLSGDGEDDHTEFSANPASGVANSNGYYVIYLTSTFANPVELRYFHRMRFIDN